MTVIRYSQSNTKGAPPDRRSYDDVLGFASSSSPRGSTYWKRVRRCPREHALYTAGLRRDYPLGEALVVGLMIHRALEHYYGGRIVGSVGQAFREMEANDEARAWQSISGFSDEPGYEMTYALVEKMLAGYFELYRDNDAKWQILAVEETVEFNEPALEWSGRFDGLIVKDGMTWLLENKTAKAITPDLLGGYQMDMQMLGYAWLFKNVIDTSKFPPFGGVLVNILTKHVVPRYERIEVCPSKYHVAEFEHSMRDWMKVRKVYDELGQPKALGNCVGAPRYFSTCDYFDLCHGQPDVSLARLLKQEPPFGFTRVADGALDPDEVA